jgi:hypothetical protein
LRPAYGRWKVLSNFPFASRSQNRLADHLHELAEGCSLD